MNDLDPQVGTNNDFSGPSNRSGATSIHMVNAVDPATSDFERGRVMASGICIVDAKRRAFGPASQCFVPFPPFLVVHVTSNYASVVFKLNFAFGIEASKEMP